MAPDSIPRFAWRMVRTHPGNTARLRRIPRTVVLEHHGIDIVPALSDELDSLWQATGGAAFQFIDYAVTQLGQTFRQAVCDSIGRHAPIACRIPVARSDENFHAATTRSDVGVAGKYKNA